VQGYGVYARVVIARNKHPACPRPRALCPHVVLACCWWTKLFVRPTSIDPTFLLHLPPHTTADEGQRGSLAVRQTLEELLLALNLPTLLLCQLHSLCSCVCRVSCGVS
jgi:hypothetical protein